LPTRNPYYTGNGQNYVPSLELTHDYHLSTYLRSNKIKFSSHNLLAVSKARKEERVALTLCNNRFGRMPFPLASLPT